MFNMYMISSPCSFRSFQKLARSICPGSSFTDHQSLLVDVHSPNYMLHHNKDMICQENGWHADFLYDIITLMNAFGNAVTCIIVGSVYPPDCAWVVCKNARAP